MNFEPTARRVLRLQAVAALQALTGITVESPFDTAVKPAKLPHVGVRAGMDRKQPMGKQGPNFVTQVGLQVIATVQAVTGELAQDAIEDLGAKVEAALFGAVPLISKVSGVSGCTTATEVSPEGEYHVARLKVEVDFEVAEVFDPFAIDPTLLQALAEMDLHADLGNVFDATGTYASPAFPSAVMPAPRDRGPDGRDEGHALLQIPTT